MSAFAITLTASFSPVLILTASLTVAYAPWPKVLPVSGRRLEGKVILYAQGSRALDMLVSYRLEG